MAMVFNFWLVSCLSVQRCFQGLISGGMGRGDDNCKNADKDVLTFYLYIRNKLDS